MFSYKRFANNGWVQEELFLIKFVLKWVSGGSFKSTIVQEEMFKSVYFSGIKIWIQGTCDESVFFVFSLDINVFSNGHFLDVSEHVPL